MLRFASAYVRLPSRSGMRMAVQDTEFAIDALRTYRITNPSDTDVQTATVRMAQLLAEAARMYRIGDEIEGGMRSGTAYVMTDDDVEYENSYGGLVYDMRLSLDQGIAFSRTVAGTVFTTLGQITAVIAVAVMLGGLPAGGSSGGTPGS